MDSLGARPDLWLPETGSVRIPVRGTSMLPTLSEGDLVEVRRAARGELFPGAVLAFPREGELVLHRLLAWDDQRFLEMGDGQGRGNWHQWPEALGLADAVECASGEKRAWSNPEAKAHARDLARKMLLRHRAIVFADTLPGTLLRRIVLRLLRPWIF